MRPRQLAPVAAASAATTIWLAFLGLLTTPFILHTLGASAYAIFALVTIMAAYLGNLEFGFGQATIRFLAQARAEGDSESEARIIQTSLVVFVGAASAAAAIALLAAPTIIRSFAHFPSSLEEEAIGGIRVAAALLSLTLMYIFASACLQALGRFRALVGYRALFGTLLSISAVTMAAVFDDVRAVLAGQAVISLASCVVAYAVLARTSPTALRPSFHRPTFRAMRGYAAFILATGLAYQVMMQGPPTVLAGKVESAEVAAFAVPAIVLAQLTTLITSSSTAFLPFASAEAAGRDRRHLASVLRSHLRLMVVVMGVIAGFIAVFAEPILRAWLGSDFASEAAAPLQILAAAALVLAVAAPPSDVARALGRPSWTFAYTIVGALCGVLTSLLLVEDHGAAGAAAGLLVGLAVPTAPFLFLVTSQLLDQAPRRFAAALGWPIGAVLVITALYWAASLAVSGLAGAALAGLILTPAYALIVYRAVLDDLERQTLRAGADSVVAVARTVGRSRRLRRDRSAGPPS